MKCGLCVWTTCGEAQARVTGGSGGCRAPARGAAGGTRGPTSTRVPTTARSGLAPTSRPRSDRGGGPGRPARRAAPRGGALKGSLDSWVARRPVEHVLTSTCSWGRGWPRLRELRRTMRHLWSPLLGAKAAVTRPHRGTVPRPGLRRQEGPLRWGRGPGDQKAGGPGARGPEGARIQVPGHLSLSAQPAPATGQLPGPVRPQPPSPGHLLTRGGTGSL